MGRLVGGEGVTRRAAAGRIAAGLGGPAAAGALGGLGLVGGCAAGRAGAGGPDGSVGRRLGAPAIPREFRALWVATVDNIDWPTEPGLSARRQRAEIRAVLETASRLRLNAILLQVRPTSDALYASRTEPWSAFLTGRQGVGPEPRYDPLEEWVREAHARGIDVHAWINPYRVRHPKSIGPDAARHVSKRRPELVREYGPYLWLDPGAEGSREVVLGVTRELLRRYDIDGVHMDDYFYPYPIDGEDFPDGETYAAYTRRGGRLGKADWRRENINRLVRDLRDLTHREKPGAIFTVSPFGIWRPDHPEGVKGFDAYARLYADSRRWMEEGWVDALMPQLYWPIESAGQPFEPLLTWWEQYGGPRTHLWPGLYLTRIMPAGSERASWEPREIVDQIGLIRGSERARGFALFSAVGVVEDRRGVTGELASGVLRGGALAPASPWAGGRRPRRAEVSWGGVGSGAGRSVRVRAGVSDEPPRFVALRTEGPGGWTTRIAPTGGRRDVALGLTGEEVRARRVVVNLAGRNGMTSEGAVLTRPA